VSSLNTIQSGEVRVHGAKDERIRVIGADDLEVRYDAWWSHLNDGKGGWGYTNLSRTTCSYYRVEAAYILAKSRLLGLEALSAEEVRIHRPDLPLRLLRRTGWKWTSTRYKSPSLFSKAIRKLGVELPEEPVLAAPRIVMYPKGPKGGQKKGVMLEADDGRAFRGLELLWKSHELQAPHTLEPCEGAGIYRQGCARGLPSYYLFGDRDAAGIAP